MQALKHLVVHHGSWIAIAVLFAVGQLAFTLHETSLADGPSTREPASTAAFGS